MDDQIANRDEARKCVLIARRALAEGDVAKAEKFAGKASAMYRSDEVEALILEIQRSSAPRAGSPSTPSAANRAGSSTPNGYTPNGHAANGHYQQTPASEERPSTSRPTAGPNLPKRNGENGVRHRAGAAAPPPAEDLGTPEQKLLVRTILKAKDFYEILSLQKDATDDDIKKSYRKLALKLHPDKNKANQSEDAFKAVSKAFSCLSDPDKRSYYDRTGYESTQAMAAATNRQRAASQPQGAQFYSEGEIDPEEIFNMFFGGAFGNTNHRVFRGQFGGQARRQQQQQQQHTAADPQRQMLVGLLQFLPLVLLLLFTLFSGSSQPEYQLAKDRAYPVEIISQRLQVPYYVKAEFEKSYPVNTPRRFRMEKQIEQSYYAYLEQQCQAQRLQQHREWSWGNRDRARNMKLPSCEEMHRLNEKLTTGTRGQHGYYY